MRLLFIASVFWLALASSACALVVEYPVTPTNSDTYSYVFSVSTNATQGGVAFHVTITAKKFDIETNSGVSLEVITRKKTDGNLTVSSQPVEPVIQVAVEKEKRIWKADFNVLRESLKNPDLYFVFGVPVYDTINGKRIPMPDADIYQIRLQDFAKP